MVLQALVFASGHAGYANQPAYARVVELIIPSFAFGALYLVFGLLPAIVLHFAYDTVWMALPLFVTSGTRAHVEQAIVVVAVLVPLWVVLVNRVRSTTWTEAPKDAWNGAWKPPEIPEAPPAAHEPVLAATSISPSVSRALPVVGFVGLIVWILASPFHTDAPPIKTSRRQAEQRAREALARRGVELDSSWTVLGHVEGQPGEINRFVWQTAGRDRYEKLLGVYVTPPSWVIRFARFHGDVAQRAEEYAVYVDGAGRDFRLSHDLAEATPGKNLGEEEARTIAVEALHRGAPPSNGDLGGFKEVSAQAAKRPSRTDWTFVFKDTRDYGLSQGEPRVSIEIAGDEVADRVQYVYVPEDWSRNERARRNLPTIFGVICTIVIIAVVVGGAVVGAIHWSRKRPFSAKVFFVVFGTVFLLGVVNVVNGWPVFASRASTAQPLELQLGIVIVTSLVFGIFSAAGLALVAGLVAGDLKMPTSMPARRGILIGISAGLAMAGAGALARSLSPSLTPLWGNLGPVSTFIPFVATSIGPVGGLFTQTLILLGVLYVLYQRPRAAAGWVLIGIALAGSPSIETIPSWLIAGATMGIVLMIAYRLVFQHQPELLLITVATLAILSTIRDGVQQMYPAALPGSLAGAMLVAVAAWLWFRSTMEERGTHADY
jgi:hypothetical protein